jgi:hypothetical protein
MTDRQIIGGCLALVAVLLVLLALASGAVKVGSNDTSDISDLTHALWCDDHGLSTYQCKLTED